MKPHLEDSIFGGDDHHGAHPSDGHDHHHEQDTAPRSRSEARRQREHGGHRRHHESSRASRLIVPLVALALLAGLAYGAFRIITPMVDGALSSPVEDYAGPGSGEVTVTVNPGDSGSAIARALVDAGVIASTDSFVRASSADPEAAAAVQPGEYTLVREMSAADALAALNDPANRYLGEPVTIREGLWKSEVFAALSEATGVPIEDYETAAEDAEAIGLPDQAGGDVEGWLFPATYTLRTDDPAEVHLKTLVDEMKEQLTDAGVAEEDWQRTLNVASIVEGEARADVDLGKVAQVVENRLADPTGPTVGRLEMDSTVNYALQKRGNLTRTEFEEAKSHPYDTYVIQGLPPGPIGNPGRAAIDAAANPTEGPWFFFVTVNLDTGETLFAETFEEHQANDRLRVQWCEDNPGKCTGGG
ncbi:endolytic transglycosylase MltG [Nostocoides sp. F2B08]|uniref:endolytic transglycosylase MltG n=1 Tax=Nostocoides sp. F2B08 TaxID=2653936 RepID=UPI0012632A8D|nr:endolytic transglycosylase MltG [Tetrasphaera sp. F2B08]KAB7744614.1 endolytic transglycosylase MltG [Tetrasphaera sp. F2B08]